MSYTPFQAPLLAGLLGDGECAAFFTVKADLDAMLAFAVALARAQAALGLVGADAAGAIERAADSFVPDLAALSRAVPYEGSAVPELVRQLQRHVGEPHGRAVQAGAFVQDAIDTSLVLRLRPLLALYRSRLAALDAGFGDLARRFGARILIARTHGQRAVPILLADRIGAWAGPIDRSRARLSEIERRILVVQFGGAAGNLHSLGDRALAVSQALGAELGLAVPQHAWQSQRDRLAEFASWMSLTTGALGKMGQDLVLMAQPEVGEVAFAAAASHGGGARPQAKAEALVALARLEAALVGGMHQSLVHEQERSGAALMLEWMILPQMALALGASLRNGIELVAGIERLGPAEAP